MWSCGTDSNKGAENNSNPDSSVLRLNDVVTDSMNYEGSNLWLRKWKEGVDFYATGNEPFWNLSMDFSQNFKFETAEGVLISSPPVDVIRAMDADVRLYKTNSESGFLDITLSRDNCIDNMSGFEQNFTVRIRYKSSTQDDFTEVKGCGNFVPNPRLHTIWALESSGNSTRSDFQQTPYIEINLQTRRLSGHNGCMEFRFSFSADENSSLITKEFTDDLMDCPDGQPVIDLMKHLSGSRLSYEFQERRLILKSRTSQSQWIAAD